MSESFTTNEKVAIFDRLYSYFTDPMGHDDSFTERELEKAKDENTKLRELVRLLLWGVDNDMPRYEELAWTQKVNALVRELGVEVDDA